MKGYICFAKNVAFFCHTARNCTTPFKGSSETACGQETEKEGASTVQQDKETNISCIDDKHPIINENYGNWLVVNKNKRQQKSRGRGQANNKANEKGKNIPGANKFSALETIENQGKEVGHAQFNFTSLQGHGPSKTWPRKKRSRIKNIPLNKVVFTATGARTISEAALAQESQKAGPVARTDQAQGDHKKHAETPIRERVHDYNNTTSEENTP